MRKPRILKTWLAAIFCMAAVGMVQPAVAETSDVDKGREIAFDRSKGNCLACHSMAGGDLPGTIGPPLVHMKVRFPDREVLAKRIWDAAEFNPMTVMPPFGRHRILTDNEIDKVVEFLYTL